MGPDLARLQKINYQDLYQPKRGAHSFKAIELEVTVLSSYQEL